MASAPKKCVVIGDACVGKTCMVAYLAGQRPNMAAYIPTICENTSVTASYKGQQCKLELCDTAGQEDYQFLRPASYTAADVFLVCFCLVTRDSFENLQTVWLPDICKHKNDARVILIGTKLDLYQSQESKRDKIITRAEIDALVKKHGFEYVQCSAMSGDGIDELMDKTLAVLYGANEATNQSKQKRIGGIRLKKCEIL